MFVKMCGHMSVQYITSEGCFIKDEAPAEQAVSAELSLPSGTEATNSVKKKTYQGRKPSICKCAQLLEQ